MKDKRNTQQVADRITEIRQELCTSIQNKGVVCPPETKFQDLHLKIDEINSTPINAIEVEGTAYSSLKKGDPVYSHTRARKVIEISNTYNQENEEVNLKNYADYFNEYILTSTTNDISVFKLDNETNQIVKLATHLHNENKKYILCITRIEGNLMRVFMGYNSDIKCLNFNIETNEITISHEITVDGNLKKVIRDKQSENSIYILTDKKAYSSNFYNGFSLNEFYTLKLSGNTETYSIDTTKQYIVLQEKYQKILLFKKGNKEFLKEFTVDVLHNYTKATEHLLISKTENTKARIYFYTDSIENKPRLLKAITETDVKEIYPLDDYSFIITRTAGIFLYYLDRDKKTITEEKIIDTYYPYCAFINDKLLTLPPKSSNNNVFNLQKIRIFKTFRNNLQPDNCSIGIVKENISNKEKGKIFLLTRCSDDLEEEGV